MTNNPNLPVTQAIPDDVRHWASGIYLSGLTGYLIPFGNIIAPLFIWLLKKDDHPFLNEHGKDVINFQLTIMFWMFILVLIYLSVLLVLTILNIAGLLIILIPLVYLLGLIFFILAMANLILMIIGAVKIYQGKPYKLPMKYNFIK